MAEPMAKRPVRLISIVRHPVYSILLPVPVVCFTGTLVTDVVCLWRVSYVGAGHG